MIWWIQRSWNHHHYQEELLELCLSLVWCINVSPSYNYPAVASLYGSVKLNGLLVCFWRLLTLCCSVQCCRRRIWVPFTKWSITQSTGADTSTTYLLCTARYSITQKCTCARTQCIPDTEDETVCWQHACSCLCFAVHYDWRTGAKSVISTPCGMWVCWLFQLSRPAVRGKCKADAAKACCANAMQYAREHLHAAALNMEAEWNWKDKQSLKCHHVLCIACALLTWRCNR